MIIHILLSYTLIFQFDFGVQGASISTCVTYWLNLIIVTLYISLKKDVVHRDSWFWFNSDCFREWWQYLKYGVPAALMLCLEWWSFEVLSIIAGMLGVVELASNVVLFNLLAI